MRDGVREITKEMYDRAGGADGKQLKDADMDTVFSIMELCGYGIYNARVFLEDGKYICRYQRGDSCN